MERWKDTLFLFIFFCAVCRVSSTSCEEASYVRCLKGLQEFSHRPHFLFGDDEEELQSECLAAQSKLDCLYRYSRRCLPPTARDDFLEGNVAQSEEVIASLCGEESTLRQEYLRIIPCLRNASEGLLYCKQKYDTNERDISVSQYENERHLRCCSFNGYRNCVLLRMEVHHACGPDTIEYADEITLAMAGSKFLETCASEFEYCTSSKTNFIKPFVSVIFLTSTISSLISQSTIF